MDLQVKVHRNQRVEKLSFSTLSFDPPRKESLICELKLRIPKLNKMTTHVILEYLDDEGDYCVLGDDEQSFQEMLNCAKVTGSADSICYRLNLKIKVAEPSPAKEFPSCISSRPVRGTGARQSRKKLSIVDHETPPHGGHVSFKESRQVTTVSSPLESYSASQQEQINQQTLKVEAIQRKINAFKGERTPTALISSFPVSSNCHLREGHMFKKPLSFGLFSSAYCKISKHPVRHPFTILTRCCGTPTVFYGHGSVRIGPPQLGPILKGRTQSGNTLHKPSRVHPHAMLFRFVSCQIPHQKEIFIPRLLSPQS